MNAITKSMICTSLLVLAACEGSPGLEENPCAEAAERYASCTGEYLTPPSVTRRPPPARSASTA